MRVQRKASQSCLVLTILSNGQELMLSSVNSKLKPQDRVIKGLDGRVDFVI